MERLFHQREWQGIPFCELDGPKRSDVADREFYAKFYESLFARGVKLSPRWVEQKRTLGRMLALEVLEGMNAARRLHVLSVGAGLGVVEGELSARGYVCDALECELGSLRWLKQQFPGVRAYVGDCGCLPCKSDHYDLAFMSAVDYCFDREQYAIVLAEMRRVVKSNGKVACICLSNLSVEGMIRGSLKSVVKKVLGRPSRQPGEVPWGYQRTIGEHVTIGHRIGLGCDRVYLLDPACQVQSVREAHSSFVGWPTFRDHIVVVVFKRTPA